MNCNTTHYRANSSSVPGDPTFTAPDAQAGDQFGLSIAVSQDAAVIGAPGDDDRGGGAGAAYVYRRNASGQWVFVEKLTASDGSSLASYGFSVAIDGGRLVVGAYEDDRKATDAGAAYVYERDVAGDWIDAGKLTAGDAGFNDLFGYTVAIDGGRIAVGAYNDGPRGDGSGSVYVFERGGNGTWSQATKLFPADGAQADHFGLGLAIDGDRLAVGAYAAAAGGDDGGQVYVYERSGGGTWAQRLGRFGPAGLPNQGYFGVQLAFAGGVLYAAAPGSAAVYAYGDSGSGGAWSSFATLSQPDAGAGDMFGWALAADGTTVLAGAQEDDDRGNNAGSAYFFTVAPAAYLSGTAFVDANRTGARDPGEGAAVAWTVYLDADDDGVKDAGEASTTTDSQGGYRFDDLLPGAYVVRLVQQAGKSQTLPGLGDGRRVTVASGQTAAGLDFGVVNQATVASGVVWNDRDGDGVRDAGEPGFASWAVYADLNDDGFYQGGEPLVNGGVNGNWSLADVPPGNRVFRLIVPPGFRTVPVGGDAARRVALAPGLTTSGVNFGAVKPLLTPGTKVTPGSPVNNGAASPSWVDGDRMIVGAPGGGNGTAYVYERDGQGAWALVQTLVAPDGIASDAFGQSVRLKGDTAVVSSLNKVDPASPAAAYVFVRNGSGVWEFQAKLTPNETDAAPDIALIGLAFDGTSVVIGVGSEQHAGAQSGAAYVFRKGAGGTWAQEAELNAPDAVVGGMFGYAGVAVDGDTAVVGAPEGNAAGAQAGAAYVFTRSPGGTWSFAEKLTASGSPATKRFGYAGVSISGNRLTVGAEGVSNQRGTIFLFQRGADGAWAQVQRLQPSTDDAGSYGGYFDALTAAISGGTIVIGDNKAGYAYAFFDDGQGYYGYETRLSAAGAGAHLFGAHVAVDGTRVAVGVPGLPVQVADAGAVYVFDFARAAYVAGKAFNDANRNGAQDAGEGALAGRTVYLDADDDGVKDAGEASFVTDGAGSYRFDDLLPGSYVVRLVQVDETSQVAPTGAEGHRVTLLPGQTFAGDFAVAGAATVVSGVVWNDRNADGVRDAVEPVIAGRTVFWDKDDDGVLDAGEPTAVSDAGGAWSIRNVLPGARAFRQVVPGGWRATTNVANDDDARWITAAPGVTNAGADLGSAVVAPGAFQKLMADGGAALDHLGFSSAVSGDWAIVGATGSDDATRGANSGAAYIYRRVNGVWTQAAKLVAPDGQADDAFGSSVAIEGDTVVVAALKNDVAGEDSGAAYVFVRNGSGQWVFKSKLTASDGMPTDYFGTTVAIEGGVIVAGAQGSDTKGINAGAAYVFERDAGGNWAQSAKLLASDGAAFDSLAWTGLVVHRGRIAIGAQNHGNTGKVYVFERNGGGAWVETAGITAPDGAQNDFFGYSIAMEGDLMAVSANGVGGLTGAVYVFKRNAGGQWVQQGSRFAAADTATGDRFGVVVAMANGVLYSGASEHGGGRGALYSFVDNGSGAWTQVDKFVAPQSAAGDSLGWGLSARGNTVVVGAYHRGDPGNESGAAFFMELSRAAYVQGTAFQDTNASGVRDAGEPALAGWTVYVDADDDGVRDAGEAMAVTDSTGNYAFAAVRPGNHVVRQEPLALWQQTSPASNQPHRVTVAAGQTAVLDFALHATATVAGKLFTDANGNGVKDGADAALAGWVVFGDLNANRRADAGEVTAVTDAQGNYTLAYLPVRTLSVDVVDGAARGVAARSVSLQQLLVQGGVDFGVASASGQTFPGTGAIAGRAAVDVDGNGEVDAFEAEGVGALSFGVWRDDEDGLFEPGLGDVQVGTVASAAGTGAYSMTSLAFGSYWLQLNPASSGMAGYSLYGRPGLKRVVVGAQQTPGVADFSILKAYTVTTLADEIPGSNTPAHLSLREALDQVRVDGKDTGVIVFEPSLYGGTINLDAAVGQLLVLDNVSILGPDAGFITVAGAGTSRILSVGSGLTVDVRGLRLTGGAAATGGGINVGFGATFSGDRLTIDDNAATQRGGGIYVSAGATATLVNSTVAGNSAVVQGGGVYVGSLAVVTLDRVTADGNQVTSTTGDGGAIYSLGDLTLRQVTLAENSAQRNGGGLAAADGSASLLNTTVAFNAAVGGSGGGIHVGAAAAVTLNNTLVAGNVRGSAGAADDLGGTAPVDAASANNLVAAGGGGLVHGQHGNKVGTAAAPLYAGVLPLGSYGGGLRTVALRDDSPAIDAGDNAAASALTADATGDARFIDFDQNGSAAVDVGAYEAAGVIWVNAATDEAVDTDGKTGLREALAIAAVRPGFEQIRFAENVFANSAFRLTLGGGELVVDSHVDVRAPDGRRVTIDGDGAGRVIRVTPTGAATIAGLTITGGGGVVDGAGVYVQGELTLSGVLLTDNAASRDGGAAYVSAGGALTLLNVTMSGNAAGRSGGGLFAAPGANVTGLHTTITANRADADGDASGRGGGAHVEAGGSVTFDNSVLAVNARGFGFATADDAWGAFAPASGFNLTGAVDGSTGLIGAGARYGSAAAPLDPGLFPLADNGGPTATHALRPGSPLTDAGDGARTSARGLSLDARGQSRSRDGDDDQVARVDVGAFEQQFPLNQAPTLAQAAATVRGAVQGVPFDVTAAALAQALGAADPEGAAIGFRIEAVLAGTLTLADGTPVTAGSFVPAGQTLRWTPPAIAFGADRSKTLAAFTVRAWDGQVASVAAASTVSVEVTTVAESVNYAVLFSGGDRADLNYPIYYENLKRTYETLVNQYGVKPHDIYVVYADGREPGTDTRGNVNSDMSFAANVFAATRDNLRSVLATVAGKADANDHFFYWTFDHGLGATNQPTLRTEEIMKGWGPGQAITDREQRVWLQGLRAGDAAASYGVPAGYAGVRAGFSTYVFAQCFAGGMLDELATGENALGPGTRAYGVAASNHYEASYSDYFAAAFTRALAQGYNTTTQAFAYALAHDGRADRRQFAANAGAWAFNVEHPWSSGGAAFPIFATTAAQQNAPNELRSIAPLKIASAASTLEVTYDMLMAAADTASPSGQAIVFSLAGVDIGQVTRNGSPVNFNDPAQRALAFGQSFVWTKPAGAAGTLAALRFQVLGTDGQPSGATVVAPIRVGNLTSPVAVDDAVTIQQNAADVLVGPTANDVGVNRRVVDVGIASHGTVSLDPATGQVRYTPAPEFLGTDRFTYLLSDGVATDLAGVTVDVVSYDPVAAAGAQVRYSATVLAPPPGWAGLGDSLDWAYRDAAPDWTNTVAVDLSEDGVVVVRTSRPDPNDGSLHYIGSPHGGYRWQSGDTDPYWNFEQAGPTTVTASNAFSFMRDAGYQEPDTGRDVFHSLQADSASNPRVLATTRYREPDNASENPGFDRDGGIWFDAGTDQQLWSPAPQYLFPADVAPAAAATNGPADAPVLAVFNRDKNAPDLQPARAELWNVSRQEMSRHAILFGWGGLLRSTAARVNAAGQAVGEAEYAFGQYHAYFYDGDDMVDLGAPAGHAYSTALGLSATGVVVGYSAPTAGNQAASLAFAWDAAGGRRGLGALSPGGWGVARDVNDDGVVVGASDDRAVAWIGGTIHDLNSLANGLPQGAVLTDAVGVNDAGQIVATIRLANGSTRAVFLDLVRLFAANVDTAAAVSRAPASFNVLANDLGNLTVSGVDTTGLKGTLSWDAQGNVTYDPAGQFASLAPGQTATTSFSYTAGDGRGGAATATVVITVTGTSALSSFHVDAVVATASGVELRLAGGNLDLSRINLYDGPDAAADAPDVRLVGQHVGAIRGSLFWDAATSTLSFVATGGPLAPDAYTLTMAGRADGVVDLSTGAPLDGDADNVPGGDYATNFTVAPVTQRTLSVRDFARGPGQSVQVGGTAGLPVAVDDAAGARAIDFELRYDPALLSVTAAALAPGMPAGWQVTFNPVAPGVARLGLFGTTALPAGARDLVVLTAAVPAGAPYRGAQRLRLTGVEFNDGAIPARGDDAVHAFAYVGDATGDRTYSALDASLIARVNVGIDSGFDAHPAIDPAIVGDASGNGAIGSLDATYVFGKSVGLAQPEVPNLPQPGAVVVPTGPAMAVRLPTSLSIAPGGFVDVPLTIDLPAGLRAFDLRLTFDATRFTVTAGDVSSGGLSSGWSVASSVSGGAITIGGFSTAALPAGTAGGVLVTVRLHARGDAAPGTSALTLAGHLNEGGLTLVSSVGYVRVSGGPAEVFGRRLFYNGSARDGHDAAANAADDAAIAADKTPLFAGQAPSASNVSGYAQGINGVMVDVAGLVGATLGDFEFRAGTGVDPAGWAAAPAPSSIVVRRGAGAMGADRVTIVWADGMIVGRWLRVTVKATANTGLAADDVFYFGSMPGDSTGDGAVDFNDLLELGQGYNAPSGDGTPATADFNVDGVVDFNDLLSLGQWYNTSLASPTWVPVGGEVATAAATAVVEAETAAVFASTVAVPPHVAPAPVSVKTASVAVPVQRPSPASRPRQAAKPATPRRPTAAPATTHPFGPAKTLAPVVPKAASTPARSTSAASPFLTKATTMTASAKRKSDSQAGATPVFADVPIRPPVAKPQPALSRAARTAR